MENLVRLLIAGAVVNRSILQEEIALYSGQGFDVVANLFGETLGNDTALPEAERLGERSVAFVAFDPSSPDDLRKTVAADTEGFDVIVFPPGEYQFSQDVLEELATIHPGRRRLIAIGCANDSSYHLKDMTEFCALHKIPIIHTSGIHAQSVAEYTLWQLCCHSRFPGLQDLSRSWTWNHYTLMSRGRLLRGRTLGVIGGGGSDGRAIISLARAWGMNVLAIGSGSPDGDKKIIATGAQLADSLDLLVSESDFLSVNVRPSLIGPILTTRHFDSMRPGIVIVCASPAENLDNAALIAELEKPANVRRLGTVVFDMPYGGRRDPKALDADKNNHRLIELGAMFTPRVAGYTIDSRIAAAKQLAGYLNRYCIKGDLEVPIVGHQGNFSNTPNKASYCLSELRDELVDICRDAGRLAEEMRSSGLTVSYKANGSPVSDADVAVERFIDRELAQRGYRMSLSGEEGGVRKAAGTSWELVVDGIDGTRNYRDGNFGWCTSVAIVHDGITQVAVVHDPVCRQTYTAISGEGAFQINDLGEQLKLIPATMPGDFSYSVGSFFIAGSTSIKAKIVSDLKTMGGRGREWGSVALSICAVARGGLGVFIQGSSYRHDHIAALLIAQEANASIRIHPSAKPDAVDVLVSHPKFAVEVESIYLNHVGK